MSKKKKFKLYSGDGGGCFGASPAYLNMAADRIQEFDGYIGTSIHAALCGAYAIGVDTRTVSDFMTKDMPRIFSRPWYSWMNPLGPKWPDKNLNESIKNLVGRHTKMKDVPKPLFITAMNFRHDTPKVFDNIHDDDRELYLWEVIRCSVAANTFFPVYCPYHNGRKDFFADGGTWANTPSTAGLVAVYDKLKIPLANIHIFSMGCGYEPDPDRDIDKVNRWGAIRMGLQTIDSMMDGGNEAAMTHMTTKLINGNTTRFRGIELDDGWGMDDASLLPEIRRRAGMVYDEFKDKLDAFLNEHN